VTGDRKDDRHRPGVQVPIGARIDRPDFEQFETAREAAGLNRRQAIIAAIRKWTRETTETPGETQ